MSRESKDLLMMFVFASVVAVLSITLFLVIVRNGQADASTEKAQLEWISRNKEFFCRGMK